MWKWPFLELLFFSIKNPGRFKSRVVSQQFLVFDTKTSVESIGGFFSIDVWNLSRETKESSRVFVFHRTHLLKEPYIICFFVSPGPCRVWGFQLGRVSVVSIHQPKHLHRVVASTTSFGQRTWPALRRQRATHGGRRIPVACGESDLSARCVVWVGSGNPWHQLWHGSFTRRPLRNGRKYTWVSKGVFFF